MTKSYTVPATGRVPTRKFWIKYDPWWTELASEEVSKREKLTWIEAFEGLGYESYGSHFWKTPRPTFMTRLYFKIPFIVGGQGFPGLCKKVVCCNFLRCLRWSRVQGLWLKVCWANGTSLHRFIPNQNKTNGTKATMPTILINQVSQPS